MTASSRRQFLKAAAAASALTTLSHASANTIISPTTRFVSQENDYHTPPKDKRVTPVIIFARFTPETTNPTFGHERKSEITWQFSTENDFSEVVSEGSMIHLGEKSFSLDVSLEQVPSGTTIYARFLYKGCFLESQTELSSTDYSYSLKPSKTIKTSLINLRKKKTDVILETNLKAQSMA